MSRFTLMENLPDLVIASTTTVTMASSYLGKSTRITVGGQQLLYTSTTTINFATTGLNALDTGAIAANTLFYIYAVKSSGGVAGLVASTAAPAVGPTGYTAWREIGRCRTAFGAATLATITNRVGGASSLTLGGSEWVSYSLVIGATTTPPTQGSGATSVAKWRRDVSSMEVHFEYTQSNAGTNGTGTYLYPLPAGYNADANVIAPSSSGVTQATVGNCGVRSSATFYYGNVSLHNSTNMGIAIGDSAANLNLVGAGAAGMGTAVTYYSFTAIIPIAEWVGLYT